MKNKRKSKLPKLPFQAQTMGNYQQKIAVDSMKKYAYMATKHTSTVTVFKPDAHGNLIAVETVGAVFVRPQKRTKLPKPDRSLL